MILAKRAILARLQLELAAPASKPKPKYGTQEWWDDASSKERREYVRKFPNTKYAKKDKPKKPETKKPKDTPKPKVKKPKPKVKGPGLGGKAVDVLLEKPLKGLSDSLVDGLMKRIENTFGKDPRDLLPGKEDKDTGDGGVPERDKPEWLKTYEATEVLLAAARKEYASYKGKIKRVKAKIEGTLSIPEREQLGKEVKSLEAKAKALKKKVAELRTKQAALKDKTEEFYAGAKKAKESKAKKPKSKKRPVNKVKRKAKVRTPKPKRPKR